MITVANGDDNISQFSLKNTSGRPFSLEKSGSLAIQSLCFKQPDFNHTDHHNITFNENNFNDYPYLRQMEEITAPNASTPKQTATTIVLIADLSSILPEKSFEEGNEELIKQLSNEMDFNETINE